MMKRTDAKEVLNIAGSIASLTGISLLWLKNLAPQAKLAIAIPVYFVASLIAVGCVALVFLIVTAIYRILFRSAITEPPSTPNMAGQIAYWGIVGGVALLAIGWLLFFIFYLAWDSVKELATWLPTAFQ